jgi:predicted murein hydrolase (TIGR00659 family)
MEQRVTAIWVYLAQTPLLWLTLTVLMYLLADRLYQASKRNPLCNPVLLAIIFLIVLLLVTNTPYETYFNGAQFVHFLLGPATVALAIPLFHAAGKLRRMLVPLLIALLVGAATAIVAVALLGRLFELSHTAILSLYPKSVTTPIAMGISEQIGGLPSLTAVLVILTGITGAMLGGFVLDRMHIRDQSVRGFAIGLASHGIGTARALQVNEEAGAFAGLAMGLNGAITALLVPLLVPLAR